MTHPHRDTIRLSLIKGMPIAWTPAAEVARLTALARLIAKLNAAVPRRTKQ